MNTLRFQDCERLARDNAVRMSPKARTALKLLLLFNPSRSIPGDYFTKALPALMWLVALNLHQPIEALFMLPTVTLNAVVQSSATSASVGVRKREERPNTQETITLYSNCVPSVNSDSLECCETRGMMAQVLSLLCGPECILSTHSVQEHEAGLSHADLVSCPQPMPR